MIHKISRSLLRDNKWLFLSNWAFPDCNSSLNSHMAFKTCTRLDVVWKRCHVVFPGPFIKLQGCFFIRNTWIYLQHAFMYGTWIFFENSTGKSYSNIKITQSLNCGKYVMYGTDWQLVCYSTFCNQYTASECYPYKTFRQFFPCSIFYTKIVLLLLVFQWSILSRFSDTCIIVTSQW